MSHVVNEDIIKQIAKLARLTVTDDEVSQYMPHIKKVLSHFSELETLNTDNIEPLITPIKLEIYLREDIASKNISSESLLAQAPEKIGQLFKVPPVI